MSSATRATVPGQQIVLSAEANISGAGDDTEPGAHLPSDRPPRQGGTAMKDQTTAQAPELSASPPDRPRRPVMSRTLRRSIPILAIPALLLGLAVPATADPSRAPHLLVGTADCGSDGTFDFLATQSNSESNTWNPAFITRSDGATGLFIPASFDLTFTSPEGSVSFTAAKGTTSGPVSCDIEGAPAPGSTLTGTVTGKIILTG
jgi:hypothetical protein